MPYRLLLAITVAISMTGGFARAQAQLPLNGYCRAGKCIPVRIESSASPIQLSGGGLIPTEIVAGRIGIVPVLVLNDAPGSLHAGSLDLPLHPLSPTEKLVGVIGDLPAPAELFPDQSIVTARLDPVHPLPGPTIAWETLDAVVFDRPIEPGQIPDLLASGITIVIRSHDKPDTIWPWRPLGDCWIIRPNLVGPSGAIGGQNAYLPTEGWQPGTSAALRRRTVLIGVLISLLFLSTLLIRSKGWLLAMLGVAIGSCITIELWRRSQSPLQVAHGSILVAGPELTQRDLWRFQMAGTSGGEGTAQLDARPILIDPSIADRISLRLVCDEHSEHWAYALGANERLALLHRTVEPAHAPLPVQSTSLSRLYELARQDYLSATTRIQGELAPSDFDPDEGQWPTVVVGR